MFLLPLARAHAALPALSLAAVPVASRVRAGGRFWLHDVPLVAVRRGADERMITAVTFNAVKATARSSPRSSSGKSLTSSSSRTAASRPGARGENFPAASSWRIGEFVLVSKFPHSSLRARHRAELGRAAGRRALRGDDERPADRPLQRPSAHAAAGAVALPRGAAHPRRSRGPTGAANPASATTASGSPHASSWPAGWRSVFARGAAADDRRRRFQHARSRLHLSPLRGAK